MAGPHAAHPMRRSINEAPDHGARVKALMERRKDLRIWADRYGWHAAWMQTGPAETEDGSEAHADGELLGPLLDEVEARLGRG